MGSLISAKNIIPMFLQILLCALVQLGALYFLKVQSWFKPIEPAEDEIITCWENTVIFTISSFQYIILACIYSKGKPFRQSITVNFWLLICSILLASFLIFLLVHPIKIVAKFFEVMPLSRDHELHLFRYELLSFPLLHTVLSVFIEVKE